MKEKQQNLWAIAIIATFIPGCTPSISESEAKPLAGAVQVSAGAIEPILHGRLQREIASVENQRFTEGKRVVALAPACEETNLNIVARNCRLVQLGLDQSGKITGADALRYMSVIENYVVALNLLVEANSKEEITNAVAVLQDGVSQLSGAVQNRSLALFAQDLATAGDAPSRIAGFLAEGAKRRAIRKLVRHADPEISILTKAIEQILNEELGIDTVALYQAVQAADRRAIEARSGPIAAHRSAVANLRAAFSVYMEALNSPLPASMRMLAASHAALNAKINGPASPQEISKLLIELQGLVATMNQIKEIF